MKYDFDTLPDRRKSFSLKWNVKENEVPMWVADMDFAVAPEIAQAIQKRAAHSIFGYTDIPPEWADSYTHWWKTRHNFFIPQEKLIFCTGVIPALSSAVRKLTSPAENIVILTPVYNIFFNSILNNGRNVLQVPLKCNKENLSYSIDFDSLEKALSLAQTTMLIFCNPHNPIGKIWSKEELAAVGELCKKYGVIVFSDEIHCDLTEPNKDYVPFASASPICKEVSITAIAPTKTFNLAGIHSAAVFSFNQLLYNKIWRALNTDEVAEPNAFAMEATIAAFTKGAPYLDELRSYIYQNKCLVQEFINSNIKNLRLTPSQATYLLWLDCSKFIKEGSDSKELAASIREKTGLYLSNGCQFGLGGENFLRMNIATSKNLVQKALELLKNALI